MKTAIPRWEILRRLPYGFLGALLLISLIERAFLADELTFRHSWAWDWLYTSGRSASPSAMQGRDVLLLGDSLTKFGLYPIVIEEYSGLTCYNLAQSAGPPTGAYFRFRSALEAGSRPRAVVFDMIPHLLWFDPSLKDEFCRPEMFRPREALELAWALRDPRYLVRYLARSAMPSLNFRDEIRAAVIDRLAGRPGDVEPIKRAGWGWQHHLGAQVTVAALRPPMEYGSLAGLRPRPFTVHPVNRASIEGILTLARTHGVRPYCLIPPLDPGLQAMFDREDADAGYLAFIEELQAAHPELVVVDARHAGYTFEEHNDPLHLNERGAAALSREMARILASPGATGRWIAMRKPADRSGPDPGLAERSRDVPRR